MKANNEPRLHIVLYFSCPQATFIKSLMKRKPRTNILLSNIPIIRKKQITMDAAAQGYILI
jgi:hypothetical protein